MFPISASQTLVTGVYRSGTEFFTMLMSGHPELSSTMYHVNVMRWAFGRYDPLSYDGNLLRAITDIASRIRERYKLDVDVERAHRALRERVGVTYGDLYDVLMSLLWLGGEKKHWMEKNQLVWREIPAFLGTVRNGRAIMVIRDPRSVLASTRKWTIAPPPAYLGAVFNCFDALQHARDYAAQLPADRFMIVRYEDAARDPTGIADTVLRFLKLDPERFKYAPDTWTGAYGEKWQFNSSFVSQKKTFNVSEAIDRWKVLDPNDLAFCEFVCGPLMAGFDYPTTGARLDWPSLLKSLMTDNVLNQWLRDYLIKNRGVQSFPLDPLNRDNWSEGRTPAEVNPTA